MKKAIALACAGALAVGVAACGGSSNSGAAHNDPAPVAAAPKAGTLAVTLNEMSIAAPSTVAAGPTTVNVTNAGAMLHEVVFVRTDTPAANLPTEADGSASEAGAVGEVADLAAGASGSTKIDLKPGHYALICNVPGHYASGMFTDLTVK